MYLQIINLVIHVILIPALLLFNLDNLFSFRFKAKLLTVAFDFFVLILYFSFS